MPTPEGLPIGEQTIKKEGVLPIITAYSLARDSGRTLHMTSGIQALSDGVRLGGHFSSDTFSDMYRDGGFMVRFDKQNPPELTDGRLTFGAVLRKIVPRDATKPPFAVISKSINPQEEGCLVKISTQGRYKKNTGFGSVIPLEGDPITISGHAKSNTNTWEVYLVQLKPSDVVEVVFEGHPLTGMSPVAVYLKDGIPVFEPLEVWQSRKSAEKTDLTVRFGTMPAYTYASGKVTDGISYNLEGAAGSEAQVIRFGKDLSKNIVVPVRGSEGHDIYEAAVLDGANGIVLGPSQQVEPTKSLVYIEAGNGVGNFGNAGRGERNGYMTIVSGVPQVLAQGSTRLEGRMGMDRSCEKGLYVFFEGDAILVREEKAHPVVVTRTKDGVVALGYQEWRTEQAKKYPEDCIAYAHCEAIPVGWDGHVVYVSTYENLVDAELHRNTPQGEMFRSATMGVIRKSKDGKQPEIHVLDALQRETGKILRIEDFSDPHSMWLINTELQTYAGDQIQKEKHETTDIYHGSMYGGLYDGVIHIADTVEGESQPSCTVTVRLPGERVIVTTETNPLGNVATQRQSFPMEVDVPLNVVIPNGMKLASGDTGKIYLYTQRTVAGQELRAKILTPKDLITLNYPRKQVSCVGRVNDKLTTAERKIYTFAVPVDPGTDPDGKKFRVVNIGEKAVDIVGKSEEIIDANMVQVLLQFDPEDPTILMRAQVTTKSGPVMENAALGKKYGPLFRYEKVVVTNKKEGYSLVVLPSGADGNPCEPGTGTKWKYFVRLDEREGYFPLKGFKSSTASDRWEDLTSPKIKDEMRRAHGESIAYFG